MLFYELNIGDKTYKLRLNTRNVVSLEKKLGTNPLGIFGKGDRIPTVTEMVNILHCSLQEYQHNLDINDAYDIFDNYIAEGKTTIDFLTVIVEVYKVSGIIKEEKKKVEEVERKND